MNSLPQPGPTAPENHDAALLAVLSQIVDRLDSISRAVFSLSCASQSFESAKCDELARIATALEESANPKPAKPRGRK